MGIFDVFLSEERRIQKNQRTLTNRDLQSEDRENAARWLADLGTPKAIVALLTRFDTNLENQLKDKTEKDFVAGLIVAMGDSSLRALERHLERCRQIAIPIRLFIQLRSEEAAITKAFEVLAIEKAKEDYKPEKKLDLLVWLAERRHPGAIESASTLLDDFDEGVRYAAAEVIIAQQDPSGSLPLEKLISNPEEDSNRLKVRLAGVFHNRGWPVTDPAALTPQLPPGYSVRDGRVVTG